MATRLWSPSGDGSYSASVRGKGLPLAPNLVGEPLCLP
jgi:hypothetical protein